MKLIGHSGCDILLLNNGSQTYVRKISKDTSYNDRLEIQCQKQLLFKHPKILAPKVYSKGYLGELFYFDMEFINGTKFNDFIKRNSFEIVKEYFNKILEFIINNKEEKFENFEFKIKHKIQAILDINLIDNKIIEYFETMSNRLVPTGYCHGDLTFENIIIANGNVYLIDFLDSFINSPVIDISKLYQELDLDWSNRNTDTNVSVKIKYQFLKNMLNDLVNKTYTDISVVNLQRKLTLMRILPYTNNLKIKLQLIDLINKQL